MDRIWDRLLDRVRNLLHLGADDFSRGAALVLTVLGTLALLSFVMAGVVGAYEKSDAPAESAQVTVVPDKGA